jgi:hypothetical protein
VIPGQVYLLRGGHVLRLVTIGPTLGFRGVRESGDARVWMNPSDVIRKFTVEDRLWLESRRDQARSRKLEEDAQDMDFVLRELHLGV